MPGKIEFHFDGPIAENHQLPLRVLGNTLFHFQSAIDRAHLDVRYGSVWKHARLRQEDYLETEFTVGRPADGGYVLDFWNETGAPIVSRISSAVRSAFEAPWREGANETESIADQVETRLTQLGQGVYQGRTLAAYIDDPRRDDLRKYGDRSIAKEVDKVLVPIRRKANEALEGENSLELRFDFEGRRPSQFRFTRGEAVKFHHVVSRRELGEPLLYRGRLRALDRGNHFQSPRAKLTLLENQRDVVLHVQDRVAYQELAPYMQGEQDVSIYACPILEFGAFEPNSGDIYFIALVE